VFLKCRFAQNTKTKKRWTINIMANEKLRYEKMSVIAVSFCPDRGYRNMDVERYVHENFETWFLIGSFCWQARLKAKEMRAARIVKAGKPIS